MRLTPVSGPRGHLPGLPSQRTHMAWDRTALALITHGALLVVRDPAEADATRIAAAGASLALALVAAALGWLRAAEIVHSDTTKLAPTARTALVILTVGVLVLGLLDLLTIAAA